MIEDKLLLWQFKRGSSKALARIYDKYERYLMTVATGLLNDVHSAEDILQDFFVSFAGSAEKIRLDGNFKAYLATCVANLAKNRLKSRQYAGVELEQDAQIESMAGTPAELAIRQEQNTILNQALAQLPYEQREVVILHVHGGMKFTQIARLRDTSVNTIQSRYRYGLDKLRTLVDSEVIL